jgi:hypothetical protein
MYRRQSAVGPQCAYKARMIFAVNNHYFPIPQQPDGLSNASTVFSAGQELSLYTCYKED